MKNKILLAVVILTLILNITTLANETVDLSTLDDEALLSLLEDVHQEIVDRKIEKTAKLERGEYIVGDTIPAGVYTLNMEYAGNFVTQFYVFADATKELNRENVVFSGAVYPADSSNTPSGEGSWNITLDQGNLLKAEGPFSLTVYAGIQFE